MVSPMPLTASHLSSHRTCRGCGQSVEDKNATGTLSQASGQFQADAAAAVAQMLGPGTSAVIEIAVRCTSLPDRDVLR